MIPALEGVGFHSHQAGPIRSDTILSPFSERSCLSHTEDLSPGQHLRTEVNLAAGFMFKPFTVEPNASERVKGGLTYVIKKLYSGHSDI